MLTFSKAWFQVLFSPHSLLSRQCHSHQILPSSTITYMQMTPKFMGLVWIFTLSCRLIPPTIFSTPLLECLKGIQIKNVQIWTQSSPLSNAILSPSVVYYVTKLYNHLDHSAMRVWRVNSVTSLSINHTYTSCNPPPLVFVSPLIYQPLSSISYCSILSQTAIISQPENKFYKSFLSGPPESSHSFSLHLYDPPFLSIRIMF